MADSETEAEYKQGFMSRVAAARTALGWKQWEMADALDIPQDKYKQYEKRSLMPHYLIQRFCLISHVDMEWLLTGRGKKLPKPLRVVDNPAPTPQKAKRTRSRKVA